LTTTSSSMWYVGHYALIGCASIIGISLIWGIVSNLRNNKRETIARKSDLIV
jgi:hypothetical protein